MIFNKNEQPNGRKRQMRRGRLFAPQNKLVRDGVQKAQAFDAEEFNFQSTDVDVGLGGQFALNRVDNGSAYIDMIALGPVGEFTLVGSIIPATDAGGIGLGSYLGSAARAYGLVRSYSFSTASDERLKKNIKDISYGLYEIEKLRPVSYNFKKGDDQTKLGFIAQETKDVLPEIVDGSEDTNYGISYDEVIPVLVKAVQELSAEVKKLKE